MGTYRLEYELVCRTPATLPGREPLPVETYMAELYKSHGLSPLNERLDQKMPTEIIEIDEVATSYTPSSTNGGYPLSGLEEVVFAGEHATNGTPNPDLTGKAVEVYHGNMPDGLSPEVPTKDQAAAGTVIKAPEPAPYGGGHTMMDRQFKRRRAPITEAKDESAEVIGAMLTSNGMPKKRKPVTGPALPRGWKYYSRNNRR